MRCLIPHEKKAVADAEGLSSAEQEAEWLRQHIAAWVERCESLTLQPMLELLLRRASFQDFEQILSGFRVDFEWISSGSQGFLMMFRVDFARN